MKVVDHYCTRTPGSYSLTLDHPDAEKDVDSGSDTDIGGIDVDSFRGDDDLGSIERCPGSGSGIGIDAVVVVVLVVVVDWDMNETVDVVVVGISDVYYFQLANLKIEQ